MRLAVLGGNSRVSHHFVNHALGTGYDIHILAQDVAIGAKTPGLTVTIGSSQDSGLLEKALQGAQAVIALPQAIVNIQTLGLLLQTMHAYHIRRLIVAADLYDSAPQAFQNMLSGVDIDWTMVRYAPGQEALKVSNKQVARYLVSQITDATYLRTSLLVAS